MRREDAKVLVAGDFDVARDIEYDLVSLEILQLTGLTVNRTENIPT